ncbi:polysaccharide biosynthesis/export family protein [Mucilaginibacter agri]|uniref:Polysaccharide export protein n=1 Tax=Mucilaginibacter agri TaxID=2695265 RepID=A0A966DSH9_9SPHI|nr:polysaccharide biosynthesis/export family protein [Mucilaginibacter agri]NCD67809.1 polysaccharide export protein [Mucilaginibacter agri]
MSKIIFRDTSARIGIIIVLSQFVLGLTSCFNEKKITYFQRGVNQKDTVEIAKKYIPKIQSGDILSIYVNSLSPEASSFFNPYTANVTTTATALDVNGGLTQAAAPGFLVDAGGKITLPLIGTLDVNNLTITEATDRIKQQLEIYLKEPTVIVRFLNYKISILGEVAKPGIYVVPNEKITLPEAITIAGDLTGFAKRNEIEIIRDVDGKKEFGEVDLTNRSVFSSPYYYLHSNDVVYVKASKAKVAQSDVALRVIPLAVSILSLIIVLIK